ncbi:unnamed protein product [Boreogadus saida]
MRDGGSLVHLGTLQPSGEENTREKYRHSRLLRNTPFAVDACSPCRSLFGVHGRMQKHEKGYTVCGLAWHPSGRQMAYTDTVGSLGLLDDLPTASSATKTPKVGWSGTPARDPRSGLSL